MNDIQIQCWPQSTAVVCRDRGTPTLIAGVHTTPASRLGVHDDPYLSIQEK
jgi:hypothetical protein